MYEDSTLFELYSLLKGSEKITCPMSWESLAALAEKANIHVKDKTWLDSMPPLWVPEKGRYDEYCIHIIYPRFNIMDGDIIVMPDCSRCVIDDIFLDTSEDIEAGIYYIEDDDVARDSCTVSMTNLDTKEEFRISAWDLLRLVDCDKIIYEKSRCLDYVNK